MKKRARLRRIAYELRKPRFSRRGLLITMVILLLSFSANMIALNFWRDAMGQYMAARVNADGFRARRLAASGFQTAISALKNIPEEFLLKYDLALNPPNIALENCKPGCFFTYRLRPEDGKLNVNNLIVPETDEPNAQFRAVFERFFRSYKFKRPEALTDALIDWIDENNNVEGLGAENENYYSRQIPSIRIKNYRMFNLSEICRVKGFNRSMIFEDQDKKRTARMDANSFVSDEERLFLQQADFIPANNLTAYVTRTGNPGSKININAARYHVLMSLSDSMTPEAVKAIFKLREQSKNYIKDIKSLKSLPELKINSTSGAEETTLYDELVGSGGELSGLLKTKGEIYRVVGVGIISDPTENNKKPPIVRRIAGLWDVLDRKLITYKED